MKHYIYIIKSLKDKKYYIGYTTNLEKRLIAHNLGLTTSTRNRRPFRLIYHEEFNDKKTAFRKERKIKSYKGGEAFKKLIAGSL